MPTRVVEALARVPRSTRTDVVTSVILAALVVLPRAGRTSFDTKLDLTVDPQGFMARSLQVWNPQAGLGELQNQAVGYLFPIGPFFALGDLAGLPPWLVQRLWQALLVVTAYVGLRLLASRLGITSLWAAWAGALAYALCPRVLTTLGPLSAETLAVSVLPWILLPLVRLDRVGGSPRKAAALSAAAVLVLGGANGAVTLAVLPAAVIWLVTRRPGPERRRLAIWWTALTTAACAWWFVPLTVLGRFSPPFLDYIETAQNTTSGITPFSALRGTTHWVAYFNRSGQPWWPAGWDLATVPVLIVATGVVAAIGLAGLASRDMPARRPLVLTLAAGVVALALGADAAGATGLNQTWRALLDGPLVPFRNIHKFDPLVQLPLALGLSYTLSGLGAGLRRAWRGPTHPSTRLVLRTTAVGLSLVAVLVSAWPLAAGRLRPEPSWSQIPAAWQEAAAFLGAQGDRAEAGVDPARALLVPSSGFGEFRWGRTIDEPLQPLAESAWVVRNQVPLGAVGTVRLLDAVERVVAGGRPSAAIAPLLARSGISHLVVRNDLDWATTGSPRPAVVRAVLAGSPGLEKVAEFGSLPAESGREGTVVSFAVDGSYPQVEIYRVVPAATSVRAVAAEDVGVLSGGPESLLDAVGAGALPADQPAVLVGHDPPTGLGEWVLTDGLRRRDRNVGRVQGNLSSTMTATEPSRVNRRSSDLLPFDPDGHQTVAMYAGIRDVRASSSAAAADALSAAQLEHMPFSAVDGDPESSWRSSQVGRATGEYLEVELDTARDVTGAEVVMEQDLLLGPRVTAVTVSTDHGQRLTRLPESGRAVLDVPPGVTRSVRLTVAETAGGNGAVGVRELVLPGVAAQRSLLLPSDPVGRGLEEGPEAIVLNDDDPPRRACVAPDPARPEVVSCDPALSRGSEERGSLDRRFDLESPRTYELSAQVVPRGQQFLGRYFAPLRSGVRATASSTMGDDLAVRPGAAVDGDPATAWVAAPGDAEPRLTLTWDEPRTLTSVVVRSSAQPAAARVQRLELTAGGRAWEVDLTSAGPVTFPPVTARSVTVRAVAWERAVSVDRSTTLVTQVPPGIAELRFPALDDLVYRPDLGARVGDLCGTGPTFLVDGKQVSTRVSARLGDLLAGTPVPVEACDSGPVLLGAGRHHVTTVPNGDWWVVGAALTSPGVRDGAPRERGTSVTSWSSSQRVVSVEPGPSSLLIVPESENSGWVGSLDGRALDTTVVDGWQQAWVLPEGDAGTVVLRYEPQRTHVAGLVLGGLAAALVVLLAVLPSRRARARTVAAPRAASRWPDALSAAAPVLVGGWVGALGVLLAGAVCWPRSARHLRSRDHWRRWTALVAFASASVLVAAGAAGVLSVTSADVVVQGLTMVALGAVVLPPDRPAVLGRVNPLRWRRG